MNRFFVPKQNILESHIIIDNIEDIKHIVKVLRLGKGDQIEVSDSHEFEYLCEIRDLAQDSVSAVILDKQGFAREPSVKIHLYQGIPKQGKMELIIQKAVELGVSSVIPVFTKRTVVVDNGKFSNKIERWQKISDEAAKQCKRGKLPIVENAIKFNEMAEDVFKNDLILFLYENEKGQTIKNGLKNFIEETKKHFDDTGLLTDVHIGIIIGPEGGFSDEEASLLKDKGAFCASLGKTVLRTETAGIAAISMIIYEFDL